MGGKAWHDFPQSRFQSHDVVIHHDIRLDTIRSARNYCVQVPVLFLVMIVCHILAMLLNCSLDCGRESTILSRILPRPTSQLTLSLIFVRDFDVTFVSSSIEDGSRDCSHSPVCLTIQSACLKTVHFPG
jgi:hypothetical protein